MLLLASMCFAPSINSGHFSGKSCETSVLRVAASWTVMLFEGEFARRGRTWVLRAVRSEGGMGL